MTKATASLAPWRAAARLGERPARGPGFLSLLVRIGSNLGIRKQRREQFAVWRCVCVADPCESNRDHSRRAMTLFRSEGWTETVARDRPSEPAQDVAVPAVSAASPDSRCAVMTQIWVVDHWTWTSWMCFESHAQAVAHPRKTDKVVRFSSNEWTELRQHTSTAPLPTTDATAATDRDSGAIVLPSGIGAETLVEFILRVLGTCDLNGNVVYGAVHPSGSPDPQTASRK